MLTALEQQFPSQISRYRVEAVLDDGRVKQCYVAIPRAERFRIDEIFVDDDYRLPRGYCPSGNVIIDIGSNVGLFALRMAIQFPLCEVHCYEPAPNSFALLSINARPYQNLKLVDKGVSGSNVKRRLFLNGLNTGESSFSSSRASSSSVLVECLDAFEEFERVIHGRVGLLKVDTEGCEVEIIQRLGAQISKVDYIFLEYHSLDDRRKLKELLIGFLLYAEIVKSENSGIMKFVCER